MVGTTRHRELELNKQTKNKLLYKEKYKVKQGLKTDFIMMTKLSYFICVCPM